MSEAIDALCRSWLDACWFLDPVAGEQAGVTGADARLGDFSRAGVERHAAALRALAVALEAADTVDLPEEIDRTALLDAIRTELQRWEQEEPHVRDPALWTGHLAGALAVLQHAADLDDAALEPLVQRVAQVPALCASAQATLDAPSALLIRAAAIDLARLRPLIARFRDVTLPQLGDLLDAGAEACTAALDAIDRLEAHLADEALADESPTAHALGDDLYERHLHFEHALRAGAPELWRVALRLREEAEAALEGAALDGRPWRDVAEERAGQWLPLAASLAERYPERDGLLSLVRQHVASRLTLEGFALLALERMAEFGVLALDEAFDVAVARLWCAVCADLDIGLHTRGLTPEAAIAQLMDALPVDAVVAEAAVAELCRWPTRGLAAVVGRRELLALETDARAHAGTSFDAEQFRDALLRHGALPVSLIRWGMGIE